MKIKQIFSILKFTFKNKSNMKNLINALNLKDWKTTVMAIVVFLSQTADYFALKLPENVTEIITWLAGLLLLIAKDPNSKPKIK